MNAGALTKTPDGRNLVRDTSGKIQYATILELDSREVADRFNAAALTAIEDFTFKADFMSGGEL